MNFFKSFLASLLGSFIALGLVAIFFFMGIAALATSLNFEQSGTTWTKENSVLDLDLNTEVRDRSPGYNPLEDLPDFDSGIIGMDEIIGSIKKAKMDDNIATYQ